MYIRQEPNTSNFDYGGKLLGWVGQEAVDFLPYGGWYGIDNAPIEIKVQDKDKHDWYTPGVVAKTGADATFSGRFALCHLNSDQKTSAYFTAYGHTVPYTHTYFNQGPGFPESKYPGPYYDPVQSDGVGFMVDPCPHGFTDMRTTSNPHDNFTYSGKEVGFDPHQPSLLPYVTVRYLDNLAGHTHAFLCLKNTCSPDSNPSGIMTLPPPKYKADGTFSGSFLACDTQLIGYSSDAQLTVQGGVDKGVSNFTTKPCTVPPTLGAHRVVSTIHHP
jgi:hypothetical protein